MKYKVYIEQIWHYSTIIEADSFEQADEIAYDMCVNIDPCNTDMSFSDEHYDVQKIN